MVTKNEVDHNTSIKSRAHEIYNQSMHTSWSPQPNVKDKWGDERKGYNIHVRLKGLAMGNSIYVRDKVNKIIK